MKALGAALAALFLFAAPFAPLGAPPAARADELPANQPAKKKTGSKHLVRSKGKQAREKDTEGTEAPNRFEADTVIKSQYKLNGESLDVDPD